MAIMVLYWQLWDFIDDYGFLMAIMGYYCQDFGLHEIVSYKQKSQHIPNCTEMV